MTESPAKDTLRGHHVALSGKLLSMRREEALAFLEMVGATHDKTPTAETDFLVLGEAVSALCDDGKPTGSLAVAHRLKAEGHEIEILTETEFLAKLGLDELLRLYTSQQLSRILGIERREIDSWVRRGLIRPVKIVNRLYYFDFGQVASAKRLQDLIQSGVPLNRIRHSLEDMESWLPGAGKSLVQLGILEEDGRLFIRLEDGSIADPSGQLQIPLRGHPEQAGGARPIGGSSAGTKPGGVIPAGSVPGGREGFRDGGGSGSAGATDTIGASDTNGTTGASGPNGTSDTGNAGDTTGSGFTVTAGSTGPTGTTGSTGPTGTTGTTGSGSWDAASPRKESAGAGSGDSPEDARVHKRVLQFPDLTGLRSRSGAWSGSGPGSISDSDSDSGSDATSRSPEAENWFEQAAELEEAGRLKEASEAYLNALAVDGPSADACFNLGNVFQSMNRLEEAIQRFLQAVEIDPGYIEAWNNLGNALFEVGRPAEAVKALRKSLATDPTYADAHYNLGEVLHSMGRDAEARQHWELYLRQDPSSDWADHVRSRLRDLE